MAPFLFPGPSAQKVGPSDWLGADGNASMDRVSPEFLTLLLIALIGAMVGSFLNVVIHRLPLGESVIAPRSRCPHCRHLIHWWENFPIFSWLFLWGRCRNCAMAISPRYVVVELLSAILATLLFVRLGATFAFLFYVYFAYSLLVLTYIDLDHQLLPDRLTLSGLLVGLAGSPLALPADPILSFLFALQGVLVGGTLLYTVAWGYEKCTGRQGMGGGDIKFLAMIGAFVGWQGVLLTLFIGSMAGSIIGLFLMVFRRADARLALPFGPFLSIGALVTLFWGPQILAWYLGRMGL